MASEHSNGPGLDRCPKCRVALHGWDPVPHNKWEIRTFKRETIVYCTACMMCDYDEAFCSCREIAREEFWEPPRPRFRHLIHAIKCQEPECGMWFRNLKAWREHHCGDVC